MHVCVVCVLVARSYFYFLFVPEAFSQSKEEEEEEAVLRIVRAFSLVSGSQISSPPLILCHARSTQHTRTRNKRSTKKISSLCTKQAWVWWPKSFCKTAVEGA